MYVLKDKMKSKVMSLLKKVKTVNKLDTKMTNAADTIMVPTIR